MDIGQATEIIDVEEEYENTFALYYTIGNGEYFKITFVIAHKISDRILRIVKCNWIALHWYSLAMNPNTDWKSNRYLN